MAENKKNDERLRLARVKRAKRIFLDHLSISANVTASARIAGVGRGTIYLWRDVDMDFSLKWADALEAATDALEGEARRRALEGYEEPVVYAGQVVRNPETQNPLMRRRYSDGLMRFLLRAHRPALFRDQPTKVDGVTEIKISVDDGEL